jgi:hypothetical protein
MHAVMLTELRSLEAEKRDEVIALRDGYEQLIFGVLDEQQALGNLRRDIDARLMTLALLDLLNWAIFWFQPGGTLTADALAEVLGEIFINGAAAQS